MSNLDSILSVTYISGWIWQKLLCCCRNNPTLHRSMSKL